MQMDVLRRLEDLEDRLLDAAVEGGPALSSIADELSVLLADCERAMEEEQFDEDALAAIADASWRFMAINEQLLELQTQADIMAATLRDDMKAKFAQIDACKEQHSPSAVSSSKSATAAGSRGAQGPNGGATYIETAYRWLRNNLHNPYPNKQTREDIARQTSSTRQHIDAWFIDVRHRIGWTALRKKAFSNKRADIVEAATIFFRPTNARMELRAEIEVEFALIQERLREFYGGRFLDADLESMLDAARAGHKPEIRKKKRRPTTRKSHQNPYPSPAHSSDEASERSLSIRYTTGSKRPIDASDSVQDRTTSPARHRSTDDRNLLPSPTPSLEDLRTAYQGHDPLQGSYSPNDKSCRSSREWAEKRAADEDIDYQRPSKRPRYNAPDQGACSAQIADELDETSLLVNWFQFNAESAKPSENVEVEVFNYGPLKSKDPVSGKNREPSMLTGEAGSMSTKFQDVPRVISSSTNNNLEVTIPPYDCHRLFEHTDDIYGSPDMHDIFGSDWPIQGTLPPKNAPSPLYPSFDSIPQDLPAQFDCVLPDAPLDLLDWFTQTGDTSLSGDTNTSLDLTFLTKPISTASCGDQATPNGTGPLNFPITHDQAQAAKIRRLEAIRLEASRLEQELASSLNTTIYTPSTPRSQVNIV